MAATKITFQDKVNKTPVTDRTKQIVAEDLNELKSAVNNHADDIDNVTSTANEAKDDANLLKTSKVNIRVGKNLFNPDNILDGKYIYYENGNYGGPGSNSAYFTTDYIPIDANGLYINKAFTDESSIIYHIYYDESKTPIHHVRTQTIPFITNAAYVRFCLRISKIPSLQIEKGLFETAYEAYTEIDGYAATIADNAVTVNKIADNAVTVNKADFIVLGDNLFNKETVTYNRYISGGNGNEVSASNWWCSDWIKVKPGTQYRSTGVRDRAYYDENRNFISGASDSVDNFTTPANAAYFRFSQYNVSVENRMLNEGSTLLPFEPYVYKFKYDIEGLSPTDEARLSAVENDVSKIEPILDEFEEAVDYDSLTQVIAPSTKNIRSFIDIAGVGADYNNSGVSFNAIRIAGAKRGVVSESRKWKYAQLFIKNAKDDSTIVAKSPILNVNPELSELGEIIFPLMDDALENYVTLDDNSFSGNTYFIYHLWFNADMSYAYGGTTEGIMSNHAGTTFYSVNDNQQTWSTYSGNPSIGFEHLLLVNPGLYQKLTRLDNKIIDLQEQVDLLSPETIEVILPDTIYAIVGDTLQLFYRGIIKAWNPYHYDILINCTKGAWFPRYFEYTPDTGDVGTVTFQLKVKDSNGKLLGSKTCNLVTRAAVQAPSISKKVLVIGDSLTNARIYPVEAYRRLTQSGGTPGGLAYSNISFVGRKPSSYGIGVEGNSGWQWSSYLTSGRKAFTFTITPPTTMPTIEAVYQDDNGKQYTMWWDYSTTSIKMIVNDGASTPPTSGSLTKVSGTGDGTITYSAIVQSSGNPFWNDSTDQLDFPAYVNKWCGGSLDIVYVLLTWNGQYGNRTDFSAFTDYAKSLFSHIKSNYPSIKIKLMGIQVSDLKGGVRVDGYPAENTYRDTYGLMVTALNMNKAYQDLANEAGYSDYVEFVHVSSQVDSEYNMPYVPKAVNTRNTEIENIGTNDVHPNANGHYQIGDVLYRNFVANFCQ